MTTIDPKQTQCWAGRWAFNRGRWRQPCPDMMLIQHVVVFEGTKAGDVEQLLLCDFHYREVLAQGLIDDPDPDPRKIEAWKAQLR